MGNFSYNISEYNPINGEDILSAISEDPNWKIFANDEKKKENYKTRLAQSPTWVCYHGDELCGYLRAVLDEGIAIYISELYVKKKYRNNKIAQQLIQNIKEKYNDILVYTLSDEDIFYEKKGLIRTGSIFKI